VIPQKRKIPAAIAVLCVTFGGAFRLLYGAGPADIDETRAGYLATAIGLVVIAILVRSFIKGEFMQEKAAATPHEIEPYFGTH
jgi:hypothetical protein